MNRLKAAVGEGEGRGLVGHHDHRGAGLQTALRSDQAGVVDTRAVGVFASSQRGAGVIRIADLGLGKQWCQKTVDRRNINRPLLTVGWRC